MNCDRFYGRELDTLKASLGESVSISDYDIKLKTRVGHWNLNVNLNEFLTMQWIIKIR